MDMKTMMSMMGGEGEMDDEALAAMMGLGGPARPPSKSRKPGAAARKRTARLARRRARLRAGGRPGGARRAAASSATAWSATGAKASSNSSAPVHYAKGDYRVGVALDDADGKNDETIKGQQFRVCAEARSHGARGGRGRASCFAMTPHLPTRHRAFRRLFSVGMRPNARSRWACGLPPWILSSRAVHCSRSPPAFMRAFLQAFLIFASAVLLDRELVRKRV